MIWQYFTHCTHFTIYIYFYNLKFTNEKQNHFQNLKSGIKITIEIYVYQYMRCAIGKYFNGTRSKVNYQLSILCKYNAPWFKSDIRIYLYLGTPN